MRKILIVGAGQSGLQLGLSLLEHGYDVTVISARTPESIRSGPVMSTQCTFDPAMEHERAAKLHLWEDEATRIEGFGLSVTGADLSREVDWYSPFRSYAQSVDQRVKLPGWLELFDERGGTVEFGAVAPADLDTLVRGFDLAVVAAGTGELGGMFERDAQRSRHDTPQRQLGMAYLHGVAPHPDIAGLRVSLLPEEGALLMVPALTLSGNCEIVCVEGVPGGPLDRWTDRPGPRETLDRLLALAKKYVPWEYERIKDAELTDANGTLTGAVTPGVRNPVAALSAGGHVLGMADVVVTNEPLTVQSSNDASHCAASYLDSIVANGDRPFDEQWMRSAVDRFREYARHGTRWTDIVVDAPTPHLLRLVRESDSNPAIRAWLTHGVEDPTDLPNWFYDAESANAYLAGLR